MESGAGMHPEVAIKEVAAAVDSLHAADLTTLTDAQLADAVIELHRITSSLEAATTNAVAVTDGRHAVAEDGARSISRWIAWKCRRPVRPSRSDGPQRPGAAPPAAVAAAFAAGEVAGEHVRLLAEAAETNCDAFDRDADMLVGYARSLNYRSFVKVIEYWRYVNAPDDEEERAHKADAGRKAHCSQTFRGWWDIRALLPAIGGAIVANELRRLERQFFDDDVQEAKERLGRSPRAGELRRTADQRRADAIVEMARRSAGSDEKRRARPLFTVLLGYEAFARMCELADGTVVTPGQVVPHLSDADIERVVFDGPSRVVDVGVRQRTFTGATRRAVEVRDRTCWHPSCDVPAEQCEIDHIEPYEAGGLTVQRNGRCACRYHHRQRHLREGGPSP